MTDKNTGWPAFPVVELDRQTGNVCDQHFGMTLRDYFMAHAPASPQRWFRPTMQHPRPQSRWASDDGKQQYESWHEGVEAEGDGEFLVNTAIDAQTQWDADYQKQHHTQWPAAWADEMIKERNK